MTLQHRIAFYEKLATMTNAGIPLRQILDRLTVRKTDPQLRVLKESLAGQSTASEAFTAARFSPFEVKMIAAGEQSGRLDESFKQLGSYWKTESELSDALKKHMAYPILLLHAVAILTPILSLVFDSIFVYAEKVALNLGCLYGFAFLFYWIARELWHRDSGQSLLLRLPLVGPFWRTTYAYRWIVALNLELAAGITFSQAASDAWEVTGFIHREKRADEAREKILHGEKLSALVESWKELPEEWADYFMTAETSGKITDTLSLVQAHALEEWKRAQDRVADWLPKLLYYAVLGVAALAAVRFWLNYFKTISNLSF